MYKIILLIILIIANISTIIPFQLYGTADYLSVNVIVTALGAIISFLYLITKVNKLTLTLALITLTISLYHVYLIIMSIYHYVYA